MIFGTQFTGSVDAGQTRTWFTHSWNANWNVAWAVIPTSPAVDGPAQLEWKVKATRQAANLIKWFIEVRNVTNVPVAFQARYAILNAERVNGTRTVTASVVLAERLPAGDHTARIAVEDVSRADAPATSIAQRVVRLIGPMEAGDRFTLELPVPEIDDHASYIVRVHIDSSGSGDVTIGDRITTRSYPVLTRGAPDHVDVEVVQI